MHLFLFSTPELCKHPNQYHQAHKQDDPSENRFQSFISHIAGELCAGNDAGYSAGGEDGQEDKIDRRNRFNISQQADNAIYSDDRQ